MFPEISLIFRDNQIILLNVYKHGYLTLVDCPQQNSLSAVQINNLHF